MKYILILQEKLTVLNGHKHQIVY